LKLADNLARPDVTGTPSEVRAWLFLAAGILPTAREVDELGDKIPDIDGLPHPASIMDFGWYLWRANEWMVKGVGLPERHIGRHYVEMYFEEGGSIRAHLGGLWPELAPVLVAQFRDETVRRTEQRWFRKIHAHLCTLPDFERMWSTATESPSGAYGWSRTPVEGGIIGAVRAPLTADPRLIVGQIVPEDSDGREQMLRFGAILD